MYSEIAANKRKTFLIFLGFILVIAGLGWLSSEMLGQPSLLYGVAIGGLLYALISYFAAGKVAVAVNHAKQISKKDHPRLYRIVENLTITEGMPMPKVYIMDDPAPNAFATGRDPNHAIVCATTGLLDVMTDTELEGVMAHELGHVKNYDIRVNLVAFAFVSVIGLLADLMLRFTIFRDDDDGPGASPIFLVLAIVAAILAPLAATLIQLAISRKREYLADATGALTTRYPEGLASALAKIAAHGSVTRNQNASTAHLFFANPLKKASLNSLFSTHPPVEDRIARLKEMGSKL